MMAKLVRPWSVKPLGARSFELDDLMRNRPAYSIRDMERRLQMKVRIYGCNLYLFTIIDWELGKTGVTIYNGMVTPAQNGIDVRK